MKRKRKIWAVLLSLMMVMALSPISTFANASGSGDTAAAPASAEVQAQAEDEQGVAEADKAEPAAEAEKTEPAEKPAEEPAEEPAVEEESEPAGEADGGIVAGALYKDVNQGDRQPDKGGNNYDASYRFGYDSFTRNSSTDLNGLESVKVGTVPLSRGAATSTVGAAVRQGVTVSFEPGYYLYQYKIVCGDKYSCQTAARGQATAATGVMSGATKASYTIKCNEGDFSHTSKKDPYWILLQLKQDTNKYKVTYDWGELNTKLESSVPVDSKEYLVNQIVTVGAPSEAAVAEAKSLGYKFTGWKLDDSVYQAGNQFGMPQRNVTLVAQWEKIETVSVSGSKTWNDNEDQDGIRPDSITVNVVAKGKTEPVASKVVTEADGWSWNFTGLPKYENGEQVVYSVEEAEVAGYTAAYNGYNITNSHTPEKTSVSGSKSWNDNDDQDGIRPEKIVVNLLADGEIVASQDVTARDGSWSWDFGEQDKFRDGGTEIEYTVQEEEVAGYTASYDGYDITNSHTPETVAISGSKTWNDNDDQDGIRPEKIVVNLLADGEIVASQDVTARDGSWSWDFGEQDKFRDGGTEIEYTVQEEEVAGYTASYDGYDITNSHTPETISVSGTKTWNDNNNEKNLRPASITINLLANGKVVNSKSVTAVDNWSWTFDGLAKYNNGEEIVYTIEEESVAGYEATVSGYNVTNTLIEVPVTPDPSDEDGDSDDGTTTDKAADNSDSSAKTGDFTSLGMLIALMMLAIAGIAGALRFRRRA